VSNVPSLASVGCGRCVQSMQSQYLLINPFLLCIMSRRALEGPVNACPAHGYKFRWDIISRSLAYRGLSYSSSSSSMPSISSFVSSLPRSVC
jgi:hypothetical protein